MVTSPAARTIFVASQRFVAYSSAIILLAGLIGNILNIVLFTCLKLFRGNQCVFYLIVGSTIDCGTLLIELSSRIIINAFHYDPTEKFLFWCKMKPMILQICMMISLTTVCFAAIDQYLSTSHLYYLRKMSTFGLAQRLTSINISIWVLHSIPFGIFYEIRLSVGCLILNKGFCLYFSFVYLFILNGVLPLLTSFIFSSLAYFNVRRIIRLQIPIVRRKLDRQLTAMILTRVAFLFLVSLPFGLEQIYSLNVPTHPNDQFRIAINQTIICVTSCLFYINYAGSFYLFLLSSTRFRRQVTYLFVKKFWRKCCNNAHISAVTQRNQVAPIPHVSNID